MDLVLKPLEGEEDVSFMVRKNQPNQIKRYAYRLHNEQEKIKVLSGTPPTRLSAENLQKLQTTLREQLLELLEFRFQDTCDKIKRPLMDLTGCDFPKREITRYFAMMVDERTKNLTAGRITMNEYSNIVIGELDNYLFCSPKAKEWMKAHPKMLPSRRLPSLAKQSLYPGNLIDCLFETILKYSDLITLQRFFPDADTGHLLQSMANISQPAESSVTYPTTLKPWNSPVNNLPDPSSEKQPQYSHPDETPIQEQDELTKSWYAWASQNKSTLLYTTDIQQTLYQL
jgi:hypothetical protein